MSWPQTIAMGLVLLFSGWVVLELLYDLKRRKD